MKKHFTVNQSVIWIVSDFEGKTATEAIITEVHSDYCIAKTEDNTTLWIDEDNEMEFFDLALQETIHGLKF